MTDSSVQLDGMGCPPPHPLRAARCAPELVGRRGGPVTGWVHRRRDHGGVVFVDLRDRTGLVQVVFKPDQLPTPMAAPRQLRAEFVLLAVRGTGRPALRRDGEPEPCRPARSRSWSTSCAFSTRRRRRPSPSRRIAGADESVRLRHRIHDLRRPPLQRALETAPSALPGASEPSPTWASSRSRRRCSPRRRPRERARLPGPESAPARRVLRAAPVPADHEAAADDRGLRPLLPDRALLSATRTKRADRQLEFTQVDLEMSFVGVDEVLEVLEETTGPQLRGGGGRRAPAPLPALSYDEAMARYGSDRPTRASSSSSSISRDVFRKRASSAPSAAPSRGRHRQVPAGPRRRGALARRDRSLESFVRKELGAKGPGLGPVTDDGTWQSPIVKFLSDDERAVDRRAPPAPARAACSSSRPTPRPRSTRSWPACASTWASASAGWTAAPGTPSSSWTSRCSSDRGRAAHRICTMPFVALPRRGPPQARERSDGGAGDSLRCRS